MQLSYRTPQTLDLSLSTHDLQGTATCFKPNKAVLLLSIIIWTVCCRFSQLSNKEYMWNSFECPWPSYSGITLWINKVHTRSLIMYTSKCPQKLHTLLLFLKVFTDSSNLAASAQHDFQQVVCKHFIKTSSSLLCAGGSRTRFVEGSDWLIAAPNVPAHWSNPPDISFLNFVQPPSEVNWYRLVIIQSAASVKIEPLEECFSLLRSDNY